MIISKSIANSMISSFLRLLFHCVYVLHLFIHSSVYGHLGCLHILTVVNRAAINIEVHFLNYSLVWIDAQEWDCWSMCQFDF